jgi:hypothetical protein
MSMGQLREELIDKIGVLYLTAWEEYDINAPNINLWLNNFENDQEKINALYLLSNFIYFGSREMRTLLKSLYRDYYRHPKISEIRRANADTLDSSIIETAFKKSLQNTRFIGMGNPSDSGSHLLYYFRQENKLSRNLFINTHEIFERYSVHAKNKILNIFKRLKVADDTVDHYVFIDDFCGSGNQAIAFSNTIIEDLKNLRPNTKVDYLLLFATQDGIDKIIKNSNFDNVTAIFELDDQFKVFGSDSRYFRTKPPGKHPLEVDKRFAKEMCEKYGKKLMESILKFEGLTGSKLENEAAKHCLGYNDCQLLIGFNHNTPDNTLPIFWYDEHEMSWYPIFKRYNKIYE